MEDFGAVNQINAIFEGLIHKLFSSDETENFTIDYGKFLEDSFSDKDATEQLLDSLFNVINTELSSSQTDSAYTHVDASDTTNTEKEIDNEESNIFTDATDTTNTEKEIDNEESNIFTDATDTTNTEKEIDNEESNIFTDATDTTNTEKEIDNEESNIFTDATNTTNTEKEIDNEESNIFTDATDTTNTEKEIDNEETNIFTDAFVSSMKVLYNTDSAENEESTDISATGFKNLERKTSLLIGPRTRQNILEGKVVRNLEDGCDNFEDYWTASESESSTLSESSIRSSEIPNLESSNTNNASFHSLLNFKAVHSPLKSKAVHSPLKSKAVQSPLKSKAIHSPLKSKSVHSPLKSKAVHSPLKSKAFHSPLQSKAAHSPLKSKAVHSLLKSKAVHSPLKSKAVHSPLKSKLVHSPLKSKAVHSPLKSKAVHSPLKSKRVLYNDTINTDGDVNVNKETSAIEFEDIPVNLGVDDNNPESEALNEALTNIVRNKLPKVSSGEIQEIHNANNSPLSCISNAAEFQEIHNINYSAFSHICNKKTDLLVSKISFKRSKKCISRSTQKDAKIKGLQLQYAEIDEKIMQMIHTNDDENKRISNSSQEEMPFTKENSNFMEERKEKSKVKKQTIKVSRNIQNKENFADDESSNESIDKNSRTLNQNVNDSESFSFENIQMKKTEDTSKHQKNKFSKKTLTVDSSHTADISVNSHEDLSYFESDIDTGEKQEEKRAAVSKNSLPCNHLNTHMGSSGRTADVINSDTDYPSKNTRKQKKNNIEDLSYSESDIDTGETQADKQDAVYKNYLPDNPLNTHMNSPGSTMDVINSDIDYPSKNTRKQQKNNIEDLSYSESDIETGETQVDKQSTLSKNSLPDNNFNTHMNSPGCTSDVINSDTDCPAKNTRKRAKNNVQKTKVFVDQHSSKNVMPQKSLPCYPDSKTFLKKSKLHKNDALCRSKVAVQINDSDNDNIDDISKSASEDAFSNMSNNNISEVCMIEKEKTTTNNKTDFIPDENISSNISNNHISEVCMIEKEKTTTNNETDFIPDENISSNMSNNHISEVCMIEKEKTTTNNKTDFIPDENISSNMSNNNISEVCMIEKEKTTTNNKTDFIPDENISSNMSNNHISEVCMIEKEKTTTNNKTDFIPDENNLDATCFNESPHFQTVKRRKTFAKKRSISIPEGNDVANTSVNFSEDSVDVSEVNMEKPAKKIKKNENNKIRQSETNRKSCFISQEDIIETSHVVRSSERQTSPRRKTRNRSVSEKNDVANRSMNFSEKPVSFSKMNKEKTTKKQEKDKNGKRRQKETNKNSCIIPHEDIVETAYLDSYSQSQTSKRRRTRNSSITEKNDFVNMPLNYSNNSVNYFDGINHKKTNKKQRKIEKYKSRQKSRSNKIISDKDIVEKYDLSISQLQTSKNSSYQNSVNIEKTAKKQRKGKNSISHGIQKTHDSSQQQTKGQKTSVSARNNFISQENDQADASMNSSENSSVNNFSVITKKKIAKKQKKVESNKSRPLHDESDIEEKNQSKVRTSKKSKSNLTKNNANKENEESNHAPIRRSIRERFAPLARWRNERLCYGFIDGNIETFGIDKGTKEDNGFLKCLYKNNKKQKIKKPKPIEIVDVAENKKKRVHLLKKCPLIPWNSPLPCNTDENPSHKFLIKRMLETKNHSSGYIHIDVNKIKPPQYIPEEDLLLTAVEGRVEIHLHDKVYILERKDMFIVPKGTAYSITNISKKRALLSYVVGNFKFLDDF